MTYWLPRPLGPSDRQDVALALMTNCELDRDRLAEDTSVFHSDARAVMSGPSGPSRQPSRRTGRGELGDGMHLVEFKSRSCGTAALMQLNTASPGTSAPSASSIWSPSI